VGLLSQFDERLFGLGDDMLIALLLAKSDEFDIIVELAGQTVEIFECGFELLALAHQGLRAAAVAPEIGGLNLAVELG
jgi:hypothetical protein